MQTDDHEHDPANSFHANCYVHDTFGLIESFLLDCVCGKRLRCLEVKICFIILVSKSIICAVSQIQTRSTFVVFFDENISNVKSNPRKVSCSCLKFFKSKTWLKPQATRKVVNFKFVLQFKFFIDFRFVSFFCSNIQLK